MTSLILLDEDNTNRRNQVADLMLTGVSEFAVARRLGIKAVEAKNYWNQWKDMLAHDDEGRDLAKDHLNRMVKHYDVLIEKSHKNLKDLEGLVYDEKISAQVNATLKNIADYEAKRVDALQKAGLLDNNDLGDELAEREEREAVLIGILQNDLCRVCRPLVMGKIRSMMTGVQPLDESEVNKRDV